MSNASDDRDSCDSPVCAEAPVPLTYAHAPIPGVATARNVGVAATNAPATICRDRSALTPSSSARSAAVILEMKEIT